LVLGSKQESGDGNMPKKCDSRIKDYKEVLVNKEALWEDLKQASLDRRHFS